MLRSRPTLLTLLALLLGVGAAVAADPARLGFRSFGKARIGMTETELARALGRPLVHVSPEAEEEGCYYATVSGLPDAVGFMMLDRRLARVDVSGPGVRTISGAEVGSSEDDIRRLYGDRVVTDPHAYMGPEGHYLTVLSSDGRHGLRFETDGQRVTGFYAGRADAIGYIEGCQ